MVTARLLTILIISATIFSIISSIELSFTFSTLLFTPSTFQDFDCSRAVILNFQFHFKIRLENHLGK